MDDLSVDGQDLCLTCGGLVMADFGGGPCRPGHMTVHRVRCRACRVQILGYMSSHDQEDRLDLYCSECMAKIGGPRRRPGGVPAAAEPQAAQYVLLRSKAEPAMYVFEVRGEVMVSWCTPPDVLFAARFPIGQAAEFCEKLGKIARCELVAEVVGVDVLV